MSQSIDEYIENGPAWQTAICRALHETARRALPGVAERMQYGKPHYLQDGKYVAGIGTAKGWVAFTIFNAAGLDAPDGLFEPGPPERRTVKIRQGQAVDYDLLGDLLRRVAADL